MANVVRSASDTVTLTFTGYIEPIAFERLNTQLDAERRQGPWRFVLCDALEITGFTASVRTSAGEMFRRLKEGGAEVFVFVVKMPGATMMAMALGFAMGLPVRTVATRDEGMALLEKHRRRLQD